jgi:dihydrodipicolinate synthase/N-acetylneuraminate lyase
MGGDGGTIATSGVVPEVVMKLYSEFMAGNLDEAKRIQFKLLDLINAMLYGTNFPEGFRAGMSLRGFNLGTTRQLLSPREKTDLEGIRSNIACILAECGFSEAASACQKRNGPPSASGQSRFDVDEIAREVIRQLDQV